MINTPKHDAEPICCCGEPMTLGVVHRKDKPCFHWYAHDAEPVAWLQLNKFGKPSSVSLEKGSQYKSDYDEGCRDIPLYTAPPSGVREGMLRADEKCIKNPHYCWRVVCHVPNRCRHNEDIRAEAEKLPQSQVVVPVDVALAAGRKLALIGQIYDGDKESRRLSDELLRAAQEERK